MRTSAKLGLRIWNLLLDPYDHEQLADNWAKVDAHDHSPGRGVLIPTEGIALEAISFPLLAASIFPEVSDAPASELEILAAEEKELAGGPTLKVSASGTYEVSLQLRAESTKETFLATGAIRVNGAPEAPLFEAFLAEGAAVLTTNFGRYELKEADELTIGVATLASGYCIFKAGRISIWRVA